MDGSWASGDDDGATRRLIWGDLSAVSFIVLFQRDQTVTGTGACGQWHIRGRLATSIAGDDELLIDSVSVELGEEIHLFIAKVINVLRSLDRERKDS